MKEKQKSFLQKFIFCTGFLLLSPSWVAAGSLECKSIDGVYKPVGKAAIESASSRDKSVLNQVFYVKRETGEILGGLFSNDGLKIEILRDTENSYEVLSTNNHSDVMLLKIDEFEKKSTFKFYAGWLGLFLVGECTSKP